jgi:hypothetical protein
VFASNAEAARFAADLVGPRPIQGDKPPSIKSTDLTTPTISRPA